MRRSEQLSIFLDNALERTPGEKGVRLPQATRKVISFLQSSFRLHLESNLTPGITCPPPVSSQQLSWRRVRFIPLFGGDDETPKRPQAPTFMLSALALGHPPRCPRHFFSPPLTRAPTTFAHPRCPRPLPAFRSAAFTKATRTGDARRKRPRRRAADPRRTKHCYHSARSGSDAH